jgi:mannitol operon transcriptional antiterminator
LDDGLECSSELKEEYSLIEQVCKELENKFLTVFTKKDICLLAVILKGSKLQAAESIEYDRVMLGQMIKNLIHAVSTELHVNLRNDFSLFQGLLAHMIPSIFRLRHNMGLYNPLTEDIKRKYPVLFMAVSNSLEKEFKNVKFPEDDISFIVLHFGSALVLREEELNFKALVVCPTGIATSKILASRIKQEFIEIGSIDTKSIKEIPNADLQQYDLIISTVRLPFFELDYFLVTPLLKKEEIEAIQTFLKANVQKLTKNKYQAKSVKTGARASKSKSSFRNVLKEVKDVHRCMEAILDHFSIYHRHQKSGYEKIITDMLKNAEQDGLLSDVDQVINQLKDREGENGIGSPNTGMGLFHCRHEKIKELIFRISHLDESCLVKGMDGNEMSIKNVLLMLAPVDLSSREQEILSLISTSLIENNEAIMIFSSANEELIREKLENIFYDYLQNNLIKE